jgi:hypothetical protein
MLIRKGCGLGPITNTDFVVDIGYVAFGGGNANHQSGRNFFVGCACPNQT